MDLKKIDCAFKLIFLILLVNSSLINCSIRKTKALEDRRFSSFVDIGSTVYYQALCLVSEATQIKMQCTSNDKIKILRTVYGYNPGYAHLKNPKIDSCQFSIKDCNFDREFSIDSECTGRNTCLMTIRKSRVLNESATYHQTCKDFNYVQINYQCLPNLPTKSICGDSFSELSHAYIMTPNFPSKINPGSNCECTLTSNFENGQILLRRVDMKLPNDRDNKACTGSYLEITENNKGTERKCGYEREVGSIYGSGASKLKLNFVTGPTEENFYDHGFWLEVLASPPKENHKIEIKCNRQDIGLNNNNLHNIIENPTIYKKLKQIHDKIKRLNKTLSDSKVDNHKTKLFLAANNKKFLNMTNNIGILGKHVNQKPVTSTADPTLNSAVTAAKNLEAEIEQFFASKSELGDQLDELDRKLNEKESSKMNKKTKGDSLEEKLMKIKNNKPSLTVHDLNDELTDEKAQAPKKTLVNNNSNKNKNIFSKEKKLDLSNKNKLVDELQISKENEDEKSKKAHTAQQKLTSIINSMKEEKATNDNNNNKKNKKLLKNLDQASENDWLKALDSLNEELDLGEKILFNKEPKESLPSNQKKKAPDSLVELMPTDDAAQIAHMNAKASFDAAAASANAHLQPLKTSHETQSANSNSTEFETYLNSDYSNGTSSDSQLDNLNNLTAKQQHQQHFILKRNTLTHRNEAFHSSLTPRTNFETTTKRPKLGGGSFSMTRKMRLGAENENVAASAFESTESTIQKYVKNIHVKAPAQWLKPFQFQFETTNENFEEQIVDGENSVDNYDYSDSSSQQMNMSIGSNHSSSTTSTASTTRITTTEIGVDFAADLRSSTDSNSIERNILVDSSTNKHVSDETPAFDQESTNKLNIEDYLNCERNLTRLTVFYSNSDRLYCYNATNETLLKCIDDILESKLMLKLGQYYYIQLQPLLIAKSKMVCSNSTIQEKYEFLTKTSTTKYSTTKWSNTKSTNALIASSTATNSIYFDEFEKENYLRKMNLKNSFVCNFMTKKSTNRKKLVWKLYLILKNQTCIPNKPFKTYKNAIESDEQTAAVDLNHHENVTWNEPNSTDVEFLNIESLFKAANFSWSMFSSNKIILIALIGCSICFILMANTILYVILRIKRRPPLVNNFPMAMDNRLLQNYLDLSVNSESKHSQSSSSPSKREKKKENKAHKDDVAFNQFDNSIDNNEELFNQMNSNFDANGGMKVHRSKLIPHSQHLCENNPLNSVSGLLIGSSQKPINLTSENLDYFNSAYEINRIPSIKKQRYSVSTVATQADMDRGSILAERKDFKYRNQELSDVESQILSIEMDLCSDAYGTSVNDWQHKMNNLGLVRKDSNNYGTYSTNGEQENACITFATNDKLIHTNKELASVTVNDYMAFKNCLNMHLKTAKENFNKLNSEQPIRNRMVFRISSLSSARSSLRKNDPKERSFLDKSHDIPLNDLTSFKEESKILDNRKEETSLFSLNEKETPIEKKSNLSDFNNTQQQLVNLSNKSFPNDLYMYLDSIAYLKEYFNSRDYLDKLINFKMNKPDQSKSDITNFGSKCSLLRAESVTSSHFDESFNRCYEKNAEKYLNTKPERQQAQHLQLQQHNEISDPNTIYSQVESSDSQTSSSSNLSKCSSNTSSIQDFKFKKLQRFFLKEEQKQMRENEKTQSSRELQSKKSSPLTLISNVESHKEFKSVSKSELDKLNEAAAKNEYYDEEQEYRNDDYNYNEEISKINKEQSLQQSQSSFFKNLNDQPKQAESSENLSRAERIKRMLQLEKESLELAKKDSSLIKTNDSNEYDVNTPQTSRFKITSSTTASTSKSFSKLNIFKSKSKEKNEQAQAAKSKKKSKIIGFKSNNANINYGFQTFYNENFYDEEEQEDYSSSSNPAMSKNVRFADDVSYI